MRCALAGVLHERSARDDSAGAAAALARNRRFLLGCRSQSVRGHGHAGAAAARRLWRAQRGREGPASMSGMLTIGAALLLGFAASGHCLAMCGGLTAALGLATARNAAGRARPILLLGYQIGRIASYSLAGFF